ncbi:hypothetical protein D3C72_2240450 [compost metagenome]
MSGEVFGLRLDRARCPLRQEVMEIFEVTLVGLQRVDGGAAFGAHHFEEGLDMGRGQVAHCVLLTRSEGILTVTSRSTGSTKVTSAIIVP